VVHLTPPAIQAEYVDWMRETASRGCRHIRLIPPPSAKPCRLHQHAPVALHSLVVDYRAEALCPNPRFPSGFAAEKDSRGVRQHCAHLRLWSRAECGGERYQSGNYHHPARPASGLSIVTIANRTCRYKLLLALLSAPLRHHHPWHWLRRALKVARCQRHLPVDRVWRLPLV
jgi:hypothetical protein